ncbi:MAG: hypothetical protein FWG65_01320 [Turicibacter sp.]|nr:hypothetical protein [Turicibacter sp.]
MSGLAMVLTPMLALANVTGGQVVIPGVPNVRPSANPPTPVFRQKKPQKNIIKFHKNFLDKHFYLW